MLIALLSIVPIQHCVSKRFHMPRPTAAPAKQQLHDTMRLLWNDHGVWTREFVVAALAEFPSTSVAADRLFKNQEDIGNAVGSFYGDKAGKALTALLKDHIKIAAEVVAAAKKGDSKTLGIKNDLWHKNAHDISVFLSKANPNINEKALTSMMNDHLALLTNVVTARLKKEWPNDVKEYDAYRAQLNHMADALTNAIILQFPAKFGQHQKHPAKKYNKARMG